MTSDLDVELEPYEKVIGNLDFSTPVGSSADPVDSYALIPHVP